MLNVDVIEAYCAKYGFDLLIIDQSVWIDGAMFDSLDHASKSVSASSGIWQAWPDAVDIDEVEELLPEVHSHSLKLQPVVEDLPQHAVVCVSLTAQSNVVHVTLISARERVTCALSIDLLSLQAVLQAGNYDLAYANNVLTISYVS